MASESRIDLSIVIPAFNEAEVIAATLNYVFKVLESMQITYEIIVVDDGSTDNTCEILLVTKKTIKKLRIIRLIHNAGHMNALVIGLQAARGEFIVTMDSDMQDPPELIEKMYFAMINERDKYENFYDVIQAKRVDRSSDSIFKRKSAEVYYFVIQKLTGLNLSSNAADFRLINKKVRDSIVQMPNTEKVLRLIIPKIGFSVHEISFSRQTRMAGESKYTLKKMIKLTFDSIFSFTAKPLKLVSIIGFILMLACVLFMFLVMLNWWQGKTIQGWTSLILTLLFLNSFNFIALGVIGEYIGRIYSVNQGYPPKNHVEL